MIVSVMVQTNQHQPSTPASLCQSLSVSYSRPTNTNHLQMPVSVSLYQYHTLDQPTPTIYTCQSLDQPLLTICQSLPLESRPTITNHVSVQQRLHLVWLEDISGLDSVDRVKRSSCILTVCEDRWPVMI